MVFFLQRDPDGLCVCRPVLFQTSAVARVPPLFRTEGLLQVRGAGVSHEEAARALLLQALLEASQGILAPNKLMQGLSDHWYTRNITEMQESSPYTYNTDQN